MGRPSATRTLSRTLQAGVSVVYQPIVDIAHGSVFAYESLARSAAFEGPVELFDAAVAQRQSGRLGRHLRQLATTRCTSHPLFLNVHPAELSEKWLVQPDDPLFLHEPGTFLEITESAPTSARASSRRASRPRRSWRRPATRGSASRRATTSRGRRRRHLLRSRAAGPRRLRSARSRDASVLACGSYSSVPPRVSVGGARPT